MNKIKSLILISALAMLLASAAACAGTTATTTITTTATATITVTATPAASQVSAVVPANPPTVTVTLPPSTAPAQSSAPTASPVSSIPVPAADSKFFIQKEISGYNRTMKIDGTYDQTPIYQDSYLSIPELYRYSPADAVYVPRIPTVTDHEDWFIRMSIPSSSAKPWEVNWAWVLKPGNSTTTVSFTIYTQDDFEAYYYNQPGMLAAANLLTDTKGVSADGVHADLLQNIGKFVILVRTNNSAGVAGWWMRIGR
jgi:hypothetical protein